MAYTWTCNKCNKNMYSAYNSNKELYIKCVNCGAMFKNPYFDKTKSMQHYYDKIKQMQRTM